jgi:CRP-like cAMP-binding protein
VDVSEEAELLQKVPLFSGLSASERKLLACTSQLQNFAPGEPLMRVGDIADCAYVILEGDVEVFATTSAGEFVVAVLGPSMIVGEIGVLIDAPRTATVRAKGAVKVLRVSPDVFLRLASGKPDRALHVMRELSEHIRNDLNTMRALREELQKARAAAGKAAPP